MLHVTLRPHPGAPRSGLQRFLLALGVVFVLLAFASLLSPSVALAEHVADVSALANGERPCSDCHTGDLGPEHGKPTSSTSERVCSTCHSRALDLFEILAGNWDGTCADPVCHAEGGFAPAVHEDYCLACHDVSQPDFTTSKTSFNAMDPVDRDTVCQACHAPGLVGTHPFHQIGSNCAAACHPGWGPSLSSATPLYTDPVSGASFADVSSKETPAALLHTIHANPRWAAGVNSTKSACASCHATAACTACHTGAIPANHAEHSASNQTANPAWVGVQAHGVVGGDQTQKTAFLDANQCASVGCHDIASLEAASSSLIEDYNYLVGGNAEDPSGANDAIATNIAWRFRASSRYTGGHMSYTNFPGAYMTATFTGERVEIVSDRDPYRGTAWVWIDDEFYGTVDTYAPVTRNQAVVFSADLEPGTHTIGVYPSGEKGGSARAAFVVVDAFRVYSSAPQVKLPACRDCHMDRTATHW